MKRNLTLSFVLKAVFGICFLISQASEAFSQTVIISQPGNSSYYEFQNNNWVHHYNVAYSYNSNGATTQMVHTAPNTNLNLDKFEYTYDSQENETSRSQYKWQNNNWTFNGANTYLRTYNAANKLTEVIEQRGNVDYRKDTYLYDLTGNLTQWTTQFWRNNTWQNNGRETYTYVNGIRTESIHEGCPPNGTTWMLLNKQIYAGWHKLNEQFTSMIRQTPDGNGGWINQTKTTITLSANGGYEQITETYNNGTWINSRRFNQINDSQKNVTEMSDEVFIKNAWRLVWLDKLNYTYTSQFDVLELAVQSQDSISPGLKNQWKFTYGNFQYFTRVLGTSENQKTGAALTIYPNPASDIINFQLSENKTQTLKVSVKDITGRTWRTQTFQANELKQLNIETLPKGIYLFQLQTETGSTVKRFIK